MNKSAKNKPNRIIRVLMTVLTVVLIFLFFDIMSMVADIQGTARVVNYAGLVRGTTQRIVKLEDAQEQQDKLLEAVDSYINGLRYGSDELNLVRLDDDEFQQKMTELAAYYDRLTAEVEKVREVGYENTNIIEMSETFFGICDQATKLAEEYSQEKATALNQLETVVIVDIAGLVVLFGIEIIRALRVAAQNRALQKKVYLDEATGLPNKNKCEELLNAPDEIAAQEPVAVCVFDLNNLRTINNNLGHDKGDEYIRSFAQQLQKVATEECFVGRDGGDEFIAILKNATKEKVEACFDAIRSHCCVYSQEHPEMAISYAAGYALSSDLEACTMRSLFRQADKNMYIDKNRAKIREAAEKQRTNQQALKQVEAMGYNFTDCLYCDALLDQYRTLRTSSGAFLAEDGSYSGAVEQIVHEVTAQNSAADLHSKLRLRYVAENLKTPQSTLEFFYERNGHHGRLTLLPLDTAAGKLHHFALGFEPFYGADSNRKNQLSRYYDQMKQSILENSNYVDALLESSQVAYAVDITHNRVEKVSSSESSELYEPDVKLPCSYEEYCKARSQHVTAETLESYRLVDTAEKLAKRFDSGDNQITIEYCETGKNGKPIWLQKTVLMSNDVAFDSETGNETPVLHGIILFKDTSTFHEREQEEKRKLEQALETADAESKAKTEFMNRMSHDFRTPINGIMGMLEIIRLNQNNPSKTSEYLDKIQISADHLLDLVNDVLDMNKLQSGEAVIAEEHFNLIEVLDEVRTLIEPQMAKKGIAYHAHRSPLTHQNLIGSPLHVKQILLNFFSNAIKYNKENGSINTFIDEVSCNSDTAEFEFKITDTGIGMSREFVENQLFKPFTQEQFGARTQYKGTGLGMSIAKALIDKMGGTVQTESAQGEGTTFTFRLPFKVDAAKVETANTPNQEDVSLAGKRILLVEDNDLNMEIAQFYLESAGAEVIKAWNGEEAVELFREAEPGTFSLILMDLMMPVMDGVEAAKAIRASEAPDAKAVPIVAMTANAFNEDRKRTQAAGMNAHLVKPLNMQELIGAVVAQCGSK